MQMQKEAIVMKQFFSKGSCNERLASFNQLNWLIERKLSINYLALLDVNIYF